MMAAAASLGALIASGDIRVSLYLTILLAAFLLSTLISIMFKHPKIVIQIIF